MQRWDLLRSSCGRVWLFDVELNPPYLEAGLVHWEPTAGDTVSFAAPAETIVIRVPAVLRAIATAATISFADEPVEFVLDSVSSSSRLE